MAQDAAEIFECTISAPEAEVRRLLAKTADLWGGELDPGSGEVSLPVAAGMYQGWLRCRLKVTASAGQTAVELTVVEKAYRLRGRAAVVLAIALVGALVAIAWPFFPALLPLAPLGVGLAIAAWFLVIARLATSSPADYLAEVTRFAEGEAPFPEDAGGRE
ncbi:MAG TPA: hypothetical protein VF017_04335 [Thermoanaerobaculia bacterium]|nr:hypothetical protein [Thermoanaerobaculia bacterium]